MPINNRYFQIEIRTTYEELGNILLDFKRSYHRYIRVHTYHLQIIF